MKKEDARTAAEVLKDHLRESKEGSVDQDAERNYAENVALLTGRGIFRGHAGLKELAEILRKELPNAQFEYHKELVDGEMGFLEWSAESEKAWVEDGADSYLIRDGKIIAQTIHYTVKQK